ncbi:predicted protein [Mycobacterium numidiamassiliense]|uniref:Uncharacterized protein n=1 Tax=Mycobacterium numidiamassiliense TaxID=1841861 RepID=A0A2U3PDT9_9MYCO|nr:hypothetical protein [Mycobacterium numidiamassiliense]SPM41934.1 predicted protein [Mycobacterium numidiamassiliense]
MGSSHKEAARQLMREHPGTTFPVAKRAVARGTAVIPQSPAPHPIPWLRRTVRENPASCYFCGDDALIRSGGDLSVDRRRVEVYCNNDQCDAREIEVIVVDDGTEDTAARTDVRILAEYGPIVDRPASSLIEEIGDWIPGAAPAARATTSVCLFCGEPTCGPAPADAAGDTGRIRLRCNNSHCNVIDVEVLVVRDGTPWTEGRGDVHGLEKIVPRREGTQVGGATFYTPAALRFTAEEILVRRVSGPMP